MPIISPIVERIANFKKLIMIACSELKVLYHSYTLSHTKNGKNNATTIAIKIKSLFFISLYNAILFDIFSLRISIHSSMVNLDVSIEANGFSGASKGAEIPVKSLITPALAFL